MVAHCWGLRTIPLTSMLVAMRIALICLAIASAFDSPPVASRTTAAASPARLRSPSMSGAMPVPWAKGDLRLSEETMEYLVLFRWPGNIRQLANEMRRMAALAEAGAVLMPEHLAPEIAASRRTVPASERLLDTTEVVVRLDQPMPAGVEHLERSMILYALKQCGGRMEETAAMLGLSRKGLYLKRLRYGLEPPSERATADVA